MIEKWKLWAHTKQHHHRVSKAKEIVALAYTKNEKWSISWSGGKDSTALLHLVLSLYPDTPVLCQCDDCDWPEKRPYVERIQSALGFRAHIVEPSFSVWDRMAAGDIGNESFCDLSHSVTREAFLEPLMAKQAELGCNGFFLGLRAEESDARANNARFNGPVYQKKSGEWIANPLSSWTTTDVFAYLAGNGVEINPCYFQNLFQPPEKIRLSWAIPTPTSMGRDAMPHIRRYYPEQYQRLRDLGVC